MAILYSEMADSHQAGSAQASALLGDVKNAATNTVSSEVPGFQTENPPEVNLGNGSIESATASAVQRNEVALAMANRSKERKKIVIDPNTDPIMINANRAVADPLKTMDDMVMETPERNGDDEIHECIEGGDEYQQTCHKTRVVRIQVIPEIKQELKWCPGHPSPNISPERRNDCDQLGRCNTPCQSRIDTIQERKVEIIQDDWIDGCVALEAQSDQGVSHYVEKLVGGSETRIITGYVVNPEEGKPTTDSEPITRDSWEKTYTYACLKKVEGNCHALRSKGCLQINAECAERIGDVCVAWKQTYRCPSNKRKIKRYKALSPRSPFCLTGDCTNSDYEANGELLDAMSQLAVLKEAQNDIRANVGIFKGQARQCAKNCAGFRDCCTTGKGWGVSLHLSDCSGEERELADWRSKKRCVFVGTYCAEKILGICTRKKSSFCCFGNKLAKLLNEQGRTQLGIGWGDQKGPDCRGLTPDELSRIDMSQMDLSELYEDIQANFNPQTQDHMAQGIELERIKENMSRMTSKVRIPTVPNQDQTQPQTEGMSL